MLDIHKLENLKKDDNEWTKVYETLTKRENESNSDLFQNWFDRIWKIEGITVVKNKVVIERFRYLNRLLKHK